MIRLAPWIVSFDSFAWNEAEDFFFFVSRAGIIFAGGSSDDVRVACGVQCLCLSPPQILRVSVHTSLFEQYADIHP